MSEQPRNVVEGRARRRASPPGTRTKAVRVQAEPLPPTTKRHEVGTRVPVVYYLCRNRHLEHPHFMEVPLASPEGLYLRDVISRLDTLRGKGMSAMYSWSCKRRYKNGFVWHDLSKDDLLLSAQGSEYVLKASELLLDQSSPPPLPDHQQNSSTSNAKVQLQLSKPTQQELPRSPGPRQGWTPSSPSPPAVSVIKDVPPPPPQLALPSSPSVSTIDDDQRCRTPHSGSSGSSSPKTTRGSMPSSCASSPPSLSSPVAAHDVATQTDEKARGDNVKLQQGQDEAKAAPKGPEIVDESHSKHPAAGENPCRKSGTLQSLIRAEAAGRRGLLEEDAKVTTSSISGKLKPANLLMRLMACGPNHPGFGFVQTSYKPRFTQLEFPSSPELSTLGALKPGTTSGVTVRASGTEQSSGTMHDSVTGKLKFSSSSPKQDGVREEEGPKGDSAILSRSRSKRMSDPSSGRIHSSRVSSFHDENEKAIKIEERLASGARVVIQCAP